MVARLRSIDEVMWATLVEDGEDDEDEGDICEDDAAEEGEIEDDLSSAEELRDLLSRSSLSALESLRVQELLRVVDPSEVELHVTRGMDELRGLLALPSLSDTQTQRVKLLMSSADPGYVAHCVTGLLGHLRLHSFFTPCKK